MPDFILAPPEKTLKQRVFGALMMPVIVALLTTTEHVFRHGLGSLTWQDLLSLVLAIALMGGIIWIFETYRRSERFVVTGNTIARYKGGSDRPRKRFKISQINRLQAEPQGGGYCRLIVLDNYDIVTYTSAFANAAEFDQLLMDRTGLEFISVQTGKTMELSQLAVVPARK